MEYSSYDSPCLGRGERSPPSTSCHCFSECIPQGLCKFPLYKITLLPQGQSGIHQNSQVHFCKAAFHQEIPQLILGHGVITSQRQDFLFLLLDSMWFPPAHFSRMSRCLWMPAQPSGASAAFLSFASPAGLLRVLSVLTWRWLMKMLNTTESGTTPGAHPSWLVPSCTLCHWLQSFQPGTSASFQFISLSASLDYTLPIVLHTICQLCSE